MTAAWGHEENRCTNSVTGQWAAAANWSWQFPQTNSNAITQNQLVKTELLTPLYTPSNHGEQHTPRSTNTECGVPSSSHHDIKVPETSTSSRHHDIKIIDTPAAQHADAAYASNTNIVCHCHTAWSANSQFKAQKHMGNTMNRRAWTRWIAKKRCLHARMRSWNELD